ncbi:MAG: hypothetical protein AAGA48_36675 [Myxococcota bacterium]
MQTTLKTLLLTTAVGCGGGSIPDEQNWSMTYAGFTSGEIEGASAMVTGLSSAPSVALQISALDILSDDGALVTLNTVVLNRFTFDYAANGITGCVAEPLIEGQDDPVVEILVDTEEWVSGTFAGTMNCDGGDLDVQGMFDAEKIAVIDAGT